MGEFVIVTGDEVMAAPAEDPDATYTLAPLTPLPVSGSSPHVQVRGLPACVPDDIEKKLKAHSPMSPQRSQSLGAEPSPSNPRTLTSPGRPTAAGSGEPLVIVPRLADGRGPGHRPVVHARCRVLHAVAPGMTHSLPRRNAAVGCGRRHCSPESAFALAFSSASISCLRPRPSRVR